MTMLSRWDPFADISRLQADMGRLLGDRTRPFSPPVDIVEEDEAIVLRAEVPGFPADSIHVHVENDVLTLSGERKFDREEKKERFHRIERSYGTFTRSFVLPKNVDAENIDADLDAGVLTLRVPKKTVADRRRIAVNASKE